jgi:hypothetical protein
MMTMYALEHRGRAFVALRVEVGSVT